MLSEGNICISIIFKVISTVKKRLAAVVLRRLKSQVPGIVGLTRSCYYQVAMPELAAVTTK